MDKILRQRPRPKSIDPMAPRIYVPPIEQSELGEAPAPIQLDQSPMLELAKLRFGLSTEDIYGYKDYPDRFIIITVQGKKLIYKKT